MSRKKFLGAGILGAVLCAAGFFVNRPQFFRSYLFAYLFWFGLASGCLGVLLIYRITGGAWGDLIQSYLEAGTLTLPWLGVAFAPILFGLSALYPWARPEAVAADLVLAHKRIYLNEPFFIVRAILFFSLWSAMAHLSVRRKWHAWAAPGLVLYVLTMTFALMDWMMSLEPHWYSTIYGIMVITGQALAALALACVATVLLEKRETLEAMTTKPFLDLGNMLLTFVMMWAYMSFSQYLIIWSANLPEEIIWYRHRQEGGWFWIAMVLIAFQFILPFLILLGRRNKEKTYFLARLAALLLAVSALNTFWLVAPAFHPESLQVHGLDAAAFIAVGGGWMMLFLNGWERRPRGGA